LANIKSLIKKEVLKQNAYPVEEIRCKIKLDANENPIALPGPLKNELFEKMKQASLNRYPEAGAIKLRERFAGYFGVNKDMIMLGNGSDELIHILCHALALPKASALIPVPTFAMYKICSLNSGYGVIEVPLDDSFDLDIKSMLDITKEKSPALIFLSYPNNPTSNCFSQKKIERLLECSKGLVVVDEAYYNFSRKTFLPLLRKHNNLVILRTLSKVGLAAMRIGFLMGSASLIHELDKVRLPYNLNTLSQISAGFYLDHEHVFLAQTDDIINRRTELFNTLKKIKGVKPHPPDANFIFFSCDFDPYRIYKDLLKKGILIKRFPPLGIAKNCLRVTVGCPDENKEFLKAFKDIISKERDLI
jgi:histidinol-phosphate aminotransferase